MAPKLSQLVLKPSPSIIIHIAAFSEGAGAAPTAVAWDDEEEKSAKPKKEKKDKKKPVKANAAAEAAMAMMDEEDLGINGEASDALLQPPGKEY